MDKYAELRALAEAATPGPWFFHTTFEAAADGSMTVPTNLGGVFTDRTTTYLTVASECWVGDAMYIAAANPERVIQALDELEALRAFYERTEEMATDMGIPVYVSETSNSIRRFWDAYRAIAKERDNG